MDNKKPIAIFLVALTIISLICGIVGFIENKKEPKKIPEVKYNVVYNYYLNKVEVEDMPTNPTLLSSSMSSNETSIDKLYAFDTYSCTNKVLAKWDEENWKLVTDNTADTTCNIYFVTTYNEFEIKATNAKVTPLTSNKIKRGENVVIKITPSEGYIYDKTVCDNNEEAEWNKDKNELTIKSIYGNTSCEASFVLSKFSVEVKVNNGTGSTKVEYEYGKEVEINIAASIGYGTPTISCTNNQAGLWKDGIFTIKKLTNETICTINFQLLQTAVTYTATLSLNSNQGSIKDTIGTTKTNNVEKNGSTSWTVIPPTGYSLYAVSCTANTVTSSTINGNIIYLNGITGNTTCTIQLSED